ncbi:hypothetical protein MKW92_018438 [Papaver armeniacum]|nr:hypothetical protein MKW92_018438 [Papaver armeniacum]
MWSFENGIILFMDLSDLVLCDPNHGTGIERRLSHISVENYSENLPGASARNAELEARNAELETRDAQLVASNAELHRKLHESQVAYENLEKHVNAQRKALKAGAAKLSSLSESTNLIDESLTVQQRVEKEQAKRVPLSVAGALEPYQITEASKTHSTSTDSYQTMTVNSLRALLKERGLMVKGKKDELIARLRGI